MNRSRQRGIVWTVSWIVSVVMRDGLLAVACGFGLIVGLSVKVAEAQAVINLSVTVKPVRGTDGTVAALEVREQIPGPTSSNAPLSLKAALSAILVQHIADSITDLQVTDAEGNVPFAISDDPPVSSDHSAYRHWRATRPTVFPVSVRYRIPTEPLAKRGEPPLGMAAAGEGVAGNGIGFLLLPENTTSDLTRFAWDLSGLPAGSVGVLTAGQGTVEVPGPPSEMTKQWVLAGPATSVNAGDDSGFHGYLVGAAPFDARDLLSWSGKAYSALGAWFKYLGLPNYNLLVRALNGPSFGTGTAGEGRGGSLISVGNAYWPGQDYGLVKNITFHEMTHQWVGQIKGRASWFEEGLTVYVTSTLPCHRHLLTPSDCASDLNRNLRNYYTSEGRNWSQQKITDAPFAKEEVREVPYARGALYFASLNAQLLARSQGKRGLQAALYPLFVAREGGKEFTQADFEGMLKQELGPEAIVEFHEAMVDGTREIVPASSAFGSCLQRVSITLQSKGGGDPVRGYEWHPITSAACTKPE